MREQFVAIKLMADGDNFFYHGYEFTVGGVILVLFFGLEQLDAAPEQDDAKNDQYRLEALNKCNTGKYKNGTQYDGTDDAPEQYPVLVLLRYSKISKNNRPGEDIVYGKRFFNQVASVVLSGSFATDTNVTGTRAPVGGSKMATSGIRPPIVNEMAEAMAACHGLVRSSSFRPNSLSK